MYSISIDIYDIIQYLHHTYINYSTLYSYIPATTEENKANINPSSTAIIINIYITLLGTESVSSSGNSSRLTLPSPLCTNLGGIYSEGVY